MVVDFVGVAITVVAFVAAFVVKSVAVGVAGTA